MMKLRYTCPTSASGSSISFEAEVAGPKDAFDAIADIQDVFEEHTCGMCKSTAIKFEVREYSGNPFYKMRCTACGATFDFGQHKDGGGLFAKRWDKENRRPMANGGWAIYRKDGDEDRQQHGGGVGTEHHSSEAVGRCYSWLQGNHTLTEMNNFLASTYRQLSQDEKPEVWRLCIDYAANAGWVWNPNAKSFVIKGGHTSAPF